MHSSGSRPGAGITEPTVASFSRMAPRGAGSGRIRAGG
ncbi:hypothetical protein D516_1095 [Rhodobacter sp. AKP1]|nr:hypothetical protein D516_1095 [Rhodobacter sp. AKP1]